jgi:2-keto-3-deoxy-L-rhamnonate aldolase RhmA
MHCNPIDYAQRMASRGFSLRTVANDTRLISLAAQELFKQLKPAKA